MSVSYESRERIAIVTIDRAERRNAVDQPTADELVAAFERFDTDGEADVAVLWGAHGTFCAGADLRSLAAGEPRRISPDGPAPMGPTRMRLSKPVVAAIEGHAVAGGLELALWCDLRVVAEDAVFGVFCRRFGVPLIDLGTIRLPRLVGQGRAMDLILTGRPVTASEAAAIGLADRVVPAGRALDEALRLATEIAAFPQTCMRNDRLSMLEQWSLPEDEAIANEFRRGLATIEAGDALAGATRFASGSGRHGSF